MRLTSASGVACVAGIILAAEGAGGARGGGGDPFAFFEPLVRIDQADRDRLDRRDSIVRILPAHGGDLGVFAASRLEAGPDALVTWTRAIAELKKGPFVQAIRRFSEPPVPQDLEGLRLDDVDLDDIRECRRGRCDLKLAADEIESMRAAIAAGGATWTEAVQHEFQRVMLARLDSYIASIPNIETSLAGYPGIDLTDSESFFYWSKERYGNAKPVIAMTHVTIIRPHAWGRPAVLVLGKEVFATHYRNASLGLAAVVRDHARDIGYLVYVNRSRVDVLGGVFGGLRRKVIEGGGRESFQFYCAPCHGADGRGAGPTAAALKTRPADLTTLARRNDGAYPRERVLDFVTGAGRPLAAHGSSDMPVWGPIFRGLDPSDARVDRRVDNIVEYVESLQATSTGASDAGNQLFRTYCASCHGTTARGNGPLAESLRHIPPDLTTYTARNGGVFPSERLRRIVDGRDVPTHGDREMPVWGDAFKTMRGGSSEAAIAARIVAILKYLEGIQVRSGD